MADFGLQSRRRGPLPSKTDKKGRATVSIVTLDADDDGKEDEGDLPKFVDAIPSANDGDRKKGEKMSLAVQGRNIFLNIGDKGGLNEDSDPVVIRYGTADLTAKGFPVTISSIARGSLDNAEDGLAIRGFFQVSKDFNPRDAGTIRVDVTNVADSSGTATLNTVYDVRAGSERNTVTITFTGTGTMDGGAVRLTIPPGWGELQDDPLKRNYIEVEVSGSGAALGDPTFEIAPDDSRVVVANLKTFGEGDKLTFTYGGGTGSREDRGAEAQEEIDDAIFTLASRGGSDGEFEDITDEDSLKELTIPVKSGEGGSGEGVVEIIATTAGLGLYDGKIDVSDETQQVHAGDDSTYLVFTYTASQTIAEGQLRFTVASGGWSSPQDDDTGDHGYTYLDGDGSFTNEQYDGKGSVTADVVLTPGDEIEIHYGAENGGAKAPVAVPNGGSSYFAIAIKGGPDTGLLPIPNEKTGGKGQAPKERWWNRCSQAGDRKCRRSDACNHGNIHR